MSELRADETAWLEWRAAGVTATDVADAYTGTYGGLYGVVARKLGLYVEEPNERQDRGHRWQPVIADAVHVLTGLYVVGEETWCENPDNDRHRATVDGFLAELDVALEADLVAVFECKTRGIGVSPNRDRWAAQVEWQLHTTGLDRALLADAVIDDVDDRLVDLRLRWIDPDPFTRENLLAVADRILELVDAGELPDPDTPSALDTVKAVTAQADKALPAADLDDLTDELRRRVELKAALSAAGDELSLIDARIRARLGAAVAGAAPGFKVSLSTPSRVWTADAEAELLAERPDLGRLVLDSAALKALPADERKALEARKVPAGARRLTVTPQENTP